MSSKLLSSNSSLTTKNFIFKLIFIVVLFDIFMLLQEYFYNNEQVLLSIFAQILLPLIFIVLFLKITFTSKDFLWNTFSLKGIKLGTLCRDLIILLIIDITIFMIISIINSYIGIQEGKFDLNEIEKVLNKPNPWHTINFLSILFVAIATLSEEVIFRGSIYKFLRTKFSILLSIIVLSSLFMIAHEYNAGFYLYTFLFAIITSLYFEKRKNLLAPWFVHFLHNIFFGLFINLSILRFVRMILLSE